MEKKYSFFALLVSGFIGVLVCAAIFCGVMAIVLHGNSAEIAAAIKFATVYKTLNENFIGDADMEKVSDAAYSAMVQALDDRWSYFMTAEEYTAYLEYQSNSYTGIGITIALKDENEYLTVEGVTEDSPASRAGVEIGDRLYAIAGQSLTGKTAAEAKELITEQNGEPFELTLLKANGETETVTVSTEKVTTEPVKYELMDNGVGYVRIKNFEDNSGESTVSAVDKLIAEGATGIIFDVRNNPGGKLSELLIALDHLLPEGEVFVNVNAAGEEYVRTSDAECVKIPMMVLVNANSYSAAEFFAEALSEYEVAEVVGSHTTGKSRSQVTIVLSDDSAVHLSTNGYLTPQRKDLAALGGITPAVEIDLDEKDSAYLAAGILGFDDDEQLQAAINELQTAPEK